MERIIFFKYQGAGNDFIIIPNLEREYDLNKEALAIKLCHRKFGIGSDGLIFIENSNKSIFKIDFLNPDGTRSFCGNGSRCAVQFAYDNDLVEKQTAFEAIDGEHLAEVLDEGGVRIEMNDVSQIKVENDAFFMDTGSPHHVSFVKQLDNLDIVSFGRNIRYSDTYKVNGTNVNAVEEINKNHIKVRTYERGVEDETLACGTGVTACALSYALKNNLSDEKIDIDAVGGKLKVSFRKTGDKFSNIWLYGPAKSVFRGEFDV